MTTKQETARNEARAKLLNWVKQGDTVYTILRHVSDSGMARWLDLYVILTDDRTGKPIPVRITYYVAQLLGDRYDNKRDAMRVDGVGQDMLWDAVYRLSSALFCPDHYDHDAAYSLKQERL